MQNTLKIGGVTEHFNLPWNLAVEQGLFTNAGTDVEWQFYPGGTGVMTEALRTGELDMAILLTEGFISAAAKGLQAKIVKEYITSPLGWGIFTGCNSGINSIYSRAKKMYAISKLGSGSHLMAKIHAEQRGELIDPSNLVEVRSLDGAVQSLTNNETNIFYWEKYTTKPFVLNGQLHMVGEFSAPWSSFLVVASCKALDEKRAAITAALDVINAVSKKFVHDQQAVALLQNRFNMSTHDAKVWLNSTIWCCDYSLRRQGLENAKQALVKVGSATTGTDVTALCSSYVQLV